MTAVKSLRQTLAAQKITLALVDDDIVVRAPKGSLTPALVADLKAYREKLIQELQTDPQTFVVKAKAATTLSELEGVLMAFTDLPWDGCQRAVFHAGYTPIAKALIDKENATRHLMLEHLSSICWNRRS